MPTPSLSEIKHRLALVEARCAKLKDKRSRDYNWFWALPQYLQVRAMVPGNPRVPPFYKFQERAAWNFDPIILKMRMQREVEIERETERYRIRKQREWNNLSNRDKQRIINQQEAARSRRSQEEARSKAQPASQASASGPSPAGAKIPISKKSSDASGTKR